MCGIFGYTGKKLDIPLLKKIALIADRRGGHSWGMVSIQQGMETIAKETGQIAEHLDRLNLHPLDEQVLGQSRLATVGAVNNVKSTQPLSSAGYYVIHNGNLPDYQSIYETIEYSPQTDTDSEAILALVERYGLAGFKRFYESAPWAFPHAIIISDSIQLLAFRYRLPLFYYQSADGYYLCSGKFHDQSLSLKEQSVYQFK